MKPVAAGIEPGQTCNADVAALIAAGNVNASRDDINPYGFAAPIAPHIAATRAAVTIDLARIEAAYSRLSSLADVVVVEGAGGAFTPLSARADMLDIAVRLGTRVMLVVAVRLGCLNHALLTVAAIHARGLDLGGWVANRVDASMDEADANVVALSCRIPAPLIADLPWSGPDEAAVHILRKGRAAFDGSSAI